MSAESTKLQRWLSSFRSLHSSIQIRAVWSIDLLAHTISTGIPGTELADPLLNVLYERGVKFAREQMQLQHATVLQLLEADKSIALTKSAAEIEQAFSEKRLSFIFGFQNARVLGKDPAYLDHYYQLGARVFALTHMGHNHFADSSRPNYNVKTCSYEVDEEHGGLSELGVKGIAKIIV